MPPQLVSLTDGPNILLDKPIVLLGRHQECDIQLGSRKVSRRHCCVAQVNDYLVVRDLGSTNGIRINGIRVMEGRLKPGDEITIGNQRYQLRSDPMEAGPVVPIRAEPERAMAVSRRNSGFSTARSKNSAVWGAPRWAMMRRRFRRPIISAARPAQYE